MSKINKIKVSGTSYDLEDKNAAKSVTLTQAEYDALVSAGTVDQNTFYVISDATPGDLSQYWTSAETQSAITQATSGKVDTSTYNAYTASTDTALAGKQTTLTAGTGIDITDNVISATGGGGSSVVPVNQNIASGGTVGDLVRLGYFNSGELNKTATITIGGSDYLGWISQCVGPRTEGGTITFTLTYRYNLQYLYIVINDITTFNNNFIATIGDINFDGSRYYFDIISNPIEITKSTSASIPFFGNNCNALLSIVFKNYTSDEQTFVPTISSAPVYTIDIGSPIYYTASDFTQQKADFTAHTANTIVHVTSAQTASWNAKSNFSGSYNDLTNKPDLQNDWNESNTGSTTYIKNRPFYEEEVAGTPVVVCTVNSEYWNNMIGCIDQSQIFSFTTDVQLQDGDLVSIVTGIQPYYNYWVRDVEITYSMGTYYGNKDNFYFTSYNGTSWECTWGGSTNCVAPTILKASNETVTHKLDSKFIDSDIARTSAVTQSITQATSGKVETSAITTSITSGSTDSQVPSAKAVYDQLGGLKLVKLTESEYTALVTKDSDTLYVVVPDPSN